MTVLLSRAHKNNRGVFQTRGQKVLIKEDVENIQLKQHGNRKIRAGQEPYGLTRVYLLTDTLHEYNSDTRGTW